MFTRTCIVLVSQLLFAYGESPCKPEDTGVYQHPDRCNQYYNCSSLKVTLPGQDATLEECGYPELFDGYICKDYRDVYCWNRYEPTDACEYITMSHTLVQCLISYPSCKNIPDGLYAHPNKSHSPMYYECINGRNLGPEQICPKDNTGAYMIFDGNTHLCKKMKDID